MCILRKNRNSCVQEEVRCVRTVRLNSMPRSCLLAGGLVVCVSVLRLYPAGGGLMLVIKLKHSCLTSCPLSLQLGLGQFYSASQS